MSNNQTLCIKITDSFHKLFLTGSVIPQRSWQNIESPGSTVEVMNHTIRGPIPETQKRLTIETEPWLPWAEAHFQERVGGISLNPGIQYKNWPLWNKAENDSLFKSNGKFSHSYMERFWPKFAGGLIEKGKLAGGIPNMGIRFEYGDYNDIIERAKQDNTSRQLYLSIWHPEDQSNGNGRVPCTLGYFFLIRDNKVHLSYFIRSCDILRHFRNDIYMACRLAQDFRDKVNPELEMGDLYMWVGSLHCFNNERITLKKYF